MEIWKNVVIPILSVLIPIMGVWLNNRPSLRESKQKQWVKLLETGAWKEAHPMLLEHAVRNYYGKLVSPSSQAIKFVLRRDQDGDWVMKNALRAGSLVRCNGLGFEDNRKWPGLWSSFRVWSFLFFVVGVLVYFCFFIIAALSSTAAGAILPFLVAVTALFLAISISISMTSAHALVHLNEKRASHAGEAPEIRQAPANEDDFVEPPAMPVKLRD